MYTYYKKIEIKEHMLYASEIAIIYNITKVNDKTKPGSHRVSAHLKKYINKHLPNYEPLYYASKKGLAQVYSKDIYEEAMKDFK